MKLLITKKSGKPFPPPFKGDGKTAIAIDIVPSRYNPTEGITAYLLENGKTVDTFRCEVLETIEE